MTNEDEIRSQDIELRERIARVSGQYSEIKWAKLSGSDDPLDQLTVTNARAIADNLLADPDIGERLRLKLVKPLNLSHSISTGTRR